MKEVLEAIENARRVLVLGHVNPDADCLGSMLALADALRSVGKTAGVLLPAHSVSRKYRFMLGLTHSIESIDEPDLMVTVDTAMLRRVNKPRDYPLPQAPICNVDHHLGNDFFGQYNWVETSAASASQMVYQLIRALGVELTSDQATLLYGGVHSDTGGFSMASTEAESLAIASELSASGAKIGWICQRLHRSLSTNEFRLAQLIYSHTQIAPCGRYAWSTATLDEMAGVEAQPSDIDDQVSIPRSIEGVQIAALFTETNSGRVRINLRAEDEINILPLAEFLGGGGHSQSAGVVMDGSVEQVADRVRNLALAYLDDPKCLEQQKVEKTDG